MKSLVEYSLASGGSIIVEVGEADGVVRATRPGEIAARASHTLEEALDAVKPAILSVISKLQNINAPGQISVEFGIKLGAKVGAVLASADAESNFNVTLSWKRDD